jgi:hypothetical protein
VGKWGEGEKKAENSHLITDHFLIYGLIVTGADFFAIVGIIITVQFGGVSFQITIGSGSSAGKGWSIGEGIRGSSPGAGGSSRFFGDIDRFKPSTVKGLVLILSPRVDAGTDFEDKLTKFCQGGF